MKALWGGPAGRRGGKMLAWRVLFVAVLLAALCQPLAALAAPAPAAGAAADEAGMAAASAGYRGKWIDINLSRQRLTAYYGTKVVLSSLMSSGVAGRRTPTGRFAVRTKIRAQAMSGPGYYLPGVPWVMYFAGANAIHGAYWHHNFGHPMSHGCINLPVNTARWVYSWASVGTPVYVHY